MQKKQKIQTIVLFALRKRECIEQNRTYNDRLHIQNRLGRFAFDNEFASLQSFYCQLHILVVPFQHFLKLRRCVYTADVVCLICFGNVVETLVGLVGCASNVNHEEFFDETRVHSKAWMLRVCANVSRFHSSCFDRAPASALSSTLRCE